MPRIFEVKELAARKRALAAESEVYRQTLKLELQNFQLYAGFLKHKWSPLRRVGAVLPLAGVAAGFWLRRKQKPAPPGLLRNAMLGWQVYRSVSPFLRRMAGQLFIRRAKSAEEPAPETNI